MRAPRSTAFAAYGLVALAGCSGTIGDPSTGNPGRGPDANVDARPAGASMRRLTEAQYRHAIAQVFGDGIETPDLDRDEAMELFSTMGASTIATSNQGVEQYHAAALDIAAQVLALRADYPELASCTPSSSDDPCLAEAVRSFGRRLWRRPLTPVEVNRHAAIAGAAGEETDALALGFTYALASLLDSPNFLYVSYAGEPDPDTGRIRFTGFEMASRLALFLWDGIPDDALLSAAEAGTLVTPEGLREEVDRMLADERADGVAARFFGEHWGVANLRFEDKNAEVFPEWSQALLDAFREEFDRALAAAALGDADLLDVLVRDKTFANPELAAFYGAPASGDGFAEIPLGDERTGLLTSGAVIAANSPSDRTSPTKRGVFVLERLLCIEVPPPPPNVDNVIKADDPDAPKPTSLRDKLEQHRKDPACAGCHDLFDPLGFTFETFDGIGAYRTEDAGEPIDATGALEGETFESVRALAQYLHDDPRTSACMARRFMTYALGRDPVVSEEAYVDAVRVAFEGGGHRFRDLATAITTSDAFRYFDREVEP